MEKYLFLEKFEISKKVSKKMVTISLLKKTTVDTDSSEDISIERSEESQDSKNSRS